MLVKLLVFSVLICSDTNRNISRVISLKASALQKELCQREYSSDVTSSCSQRQECCQLVCNNQLLWNADVPAKCAPSGYNCPDHLSSGCFKIHVVHSTVKEYTIGFHQD